MIEFSTPITPERQALLAANRAELCRVGREGKKINPSNWLIWQNRVKSAGEAYKIAKTAYTDVDFEGMPKDADEVVSGIDPLFPDWPTYRDNFILDWLSNRIVVTEKEAEAMFDETAAAALAALEGTEAAIVPTDTIVPTETVATPAPVETEVVVVAKRRGRPPGVKKTAAVVAPVVKAKKSYYVPVGKRKAKKTKAKKVAKAKSNRGSASAKAQTLIERYVAKDWSRKDIIAKLQSQLDMGAAYAATLYQKFA